MRKIMKATLILAIFFIVAICGMFAAPADGADARQLDGDEFDTVFYNNFDQLSAEHYGGDISLVANKEIVYDMKLNPMGYVYDFSVNGVNGYAIILNTTGIPEPAEFYFDVEDPYCDVSDAKRIFVSSFNYLTFCDGKFYWAENDEEIPQTVIDQYRNEALYSQAEDYTYIHESIYYTTKNENLHNLAYHYPQLTPLSDYPNSCASLAGANIIQYWDRVKTNLIPNYIPYTMFCNSIWYNDSSEETDNVNIQLYYDMTTNFYGPGTSIPRFKVGMTLYCERQGYTFHNHSLMNNGEFDFDLAKEKMGFGQPIVLFLDTFTVADIACNEGFDTISFYMSNGAHVMVGFGYNEVTYTLTDGSTRVDKYISVTSGVLLRPTGYFNPTYCTQIDDAFSIYML